MSVHNWQNMQIIPRDGQRVEVWHEVWKCVITVFFPRPESNFVHTADLTHQWPVEAFAAWRQTSPPPNLEVKR